MSENQLSEEKRKQLDTVMLEWEKAIKQAEKETPLPDGRHLDGERTWAMAKINSEYMERIKAIRGEGN